MSEVEILEPEVLPEIEIQRGLPEEGEEWNVPVPIVQPYPKNKIVFNKNDCSLAMNSSK